MANDNLQHQAQMIFKKWFIEQDNPKRERWPFSKLIERTTFPLNYRLPDILLRQRCDFFIKTPACHAIADFLKQTDMPFVIYRQNVFLAIFRHDYELLHN